jgi:serine/threonine-protein kinase HipA
LFDIKSGVLRAATVHAHYILKPPGDYDQLPENEHVSMAIAREAGFIVPDIGIFDSKVGRIFAIKRFDLVGNEQERLEDFAQILRIPSERKYETSNESVASSLRLHSDIPAIDLKDFWERLLFCYLIGNADMHLKNWSLLEMKTLKGLFSLSPCYDLLNTRLAIPKEKIDIGLTLRGKQSNLQWSYFRDFAKDYGLEKTFISETRDKLKDWFHIIQSKINVCLLDPVKKETYLKISSKRLGNLL